MYKDILTQSGLSPNEAMVYEYLLKNGESTAGQIIQKAPIKRGVAYNALAELAKKGLIKETVGKVAKYQPEHPEKLRDYIENKERTVKKAKNTLESNITGLISDFNLISGKPGVRMFEGKDGLIKVLNDSLNAKTEILTYADIFGMNKYLGGYNNVYIKNRKKMGIKKRGIVADTPYARDFLKDYDRSVTEIRMIDGKKHPLYLEMEIYDNKISFMTFSEKSLIGVIMENKEIYETQKSIFELVWENATPLEKIIPSESNPAQLPSQPAK